MTESYEKLQEEVKKLKIEPPLQGFENKYQDTTFPVNFIS